MVRKTKEDVGGLRRPRKCVGMREEMSCYVVNSTATNVPTTAVDVGNVTQYTLGGLDPGKQYSITVRAYQGLLGPGTSGVTSVIPSGKKAQRVFQLALYNINI